MSTMIKVAKKAYPLLPRVQRAIQPTALVSSINPQPFFIKGGNLDATSKLLPSPSWNRQQQSRRQSIHNIYSQTRPLSGTASAGKTVLAGNTGEKNALKRLRDRLLKSSLGSWSMNELSMLHFLCEECFNNSILNSKERAEWTTKLLIRCIDEVAAGNNNNNKFLKSREVMQLMHRVIFAWSTTYHEDNNMESIQRVLYLAMYIREKAYETGDARLLPSDKAVTMIFHLLAQNPAQTSHDVEKLLQERLEQQPATVRPPPDLPFWNACLYALARSSPHQAEAAIKVQNIFDTKMSQPPDAKTYAAVMLGWAKSGRPEAGQRTQALLDDMMQKTIYNNYCFNLCIEAWAKSGHPSKAEELLWKMQAISGQTKQPDLHPDQVSFMAVIHGWRISNDPQAGHRAEELLRRMQSLHNVGKPSLAPSTPQYNAMLDAWARQPNAGPKVEGILRRMMDLSLGSLYGSNVQPSLETYTAAIKAWANTTNVVEAPERAEALLWELDRLHGDGREDLQPNVTAFNLALKAWAKSQRKDAPECAMVMFRKMGKIVPPKAKAYHALMGVFARHGRPLDVEILMEEMEDETGIFPDASTFIALIRAYGNSGLDDASDRCRAILLDLEKSLDTGSDRVRPTPGIYAATVMACQQSSTAEEAASILWDMQTRYESVEGATAPTTTVCNAVLNAWSRSGEGVAPQRSDDLLRWMWQQVANGNDNVRPDKTSYDLVMRVWARSKRRRAVEHIKRLLDEMSHQTGINPDSWSYDQLQLAINNNS